MKNYLFRCCGGYNDGYEDHMWTGDIVITAPNKDEAWEDLLNNYSIYKAELVEVFPLA